MMTLVYGFPGSGKTSFLLSFPPPLFMVNLDRDPSELFRQLPENYEVTYERIQYDVDMTPAKANSVLSKVGAMAQLAINHARENPERPGSFLFDGFDLQWEYVKEAKLPPSRGDGIAAKEYADANTWMLGLLSKLYYSPLQVGLSALAKEIWNKQSSGSGTYDPEGFRHRGRWMTHEIYMFSPEEVVPREKPRAEGLGQSHRSYIKVSKFNEQKLVRLIVPNLTFATVYKLSFGENHPQQDELWTPSSSQTTDSP
jgi:hypothetical protein